LSFTLKNLTPLFQVYDLKRSIGFYRDVLGFELIMGDDSWWAMLRHGHVKIMLNTAYEAEERPATPEMARITAHADSALYFWVDDPEAVLARLQAKNWPSAGPIVTAYGMKEVFTADPDGFQLCFQAPVDPPVAPTGP